MTQGGPRGSVDGASTASTGERFRFPTGVAPIMAMQLSTATKPTMKVRMFQGQKMQSTEGFKLIEPLLGDKVGQHGRIGQVISILEVLMARDWREAS